MTDERTRLEDYGKLILRLAVGGLMLFHGVHKAGNGIDGIVQMVTGKGLPEALAYGVYVGEILAPIGLLLGLFVRTSGLLVAFTMAMAIGLAHSGDLTALTEHGAWAVELQMLYLLGGLSLAFLGGGRIGLLKR